MGCKGDRINHRIMEMGLRYPQSGGSHQCVSSTVLAVSLPVRSIESRRKGGLSRLDPASSATRRHWNCLTSSTVLLPDAKLRTSIRSLKSLSTTSEEAAFRPQWSHDHLRVRTANLERRNRHCGMYFIRHFSVRNSPRDSCPRSTQVHMKTTIALCESDTK